MDAIVERIHELVYRSSGPIASVEELRLQPSEEVLHRRVVGRAALSRHRTRDAAPFAPLYPPGPLAAAARIAGPMGLSPSASLAAAASNMEFANSALGEVDWAQLTHNPSRQSMIELE